MATVKPEVVLVIFLGTVSMMVLIVNDWWKRRLVDKAERQGKRSRKDLYVDQTRWGMVVVFALALAAYAYLLNHRELTEGDFGALTPLIRCLFSKPG